MLKRWIITFFFCAAIVVALGIFKFIEIQRSIDAQAAQPEYFETVETFTPRLVNYAPTVKTLGLAIAPQQVTLRNELSGYITAVNYQSGERVSSGEIIIQLDISEQMANLASAQAQEELANIVYERNLELRQTNLVDQESVDRSLSELNVIKALITGIRSVINRRTIRAPFAGVIGIHEYEPGAYLNINSEITTLVGDSEEMWVDFSLSQFYGELAIGTSILVRPVRSSSVGSNPFFEATIIAGNSFISTAARSRLYRAVVPKLDVTLLHNASLEVEVPVGENRALIAVPTQSVRGSIDGQFIFVLEPDSVQNTYRARPLAVTIEGEEEGLVFVASVDVADELTSDHLIAAAGAFKLSAGVLVHLSARPEISTMAGSE